MGMFLNSKVPFEAYKAVVSGKYFVDKSRLTEELLPALGTEERFYCITRPRRFGKSIMASMIGSFFGKAADGSGIFCNLAISEYAGYKSYLNKDALFHMPFVTEENKKAYLLFLKSLLKGKVYVEFAYMTGILPIAKYSSGSELNMFLEYDMATKVKFSEFFGFDDAEVDALFQIYYQHTKHPRIGREELSIWYDGYYTAGGNRMYNPRSVVCALTDNQVSNYWTSSGPYDELFYYIRNNVNDVKADIALMVSGEQVEIKLDSYGATTTELHTKNQIYSAMVVYGFLTYDQETYKVSFYS